jgi:hypothetical protein
MRKTILALILVLLSTAVYAAKSQPDGPLPLADDYTVLAGKVTIGTIGEHMIGVMIDDGGPYRHLFRFWTNGSVKPFRATSQSASVEFRGDELIAMAADEEWFYALQINNAGNRAPRQPMGFTGTSYAGYGLNHEIRPVSVQTGSGRRRIAALDCEDLDRCIVNPDPGSSGSGGGSSCDSGGPNTSQCSTSNTHGSCSVTCTYGYSCCVNATATSNASCTCKTM